MCHALVPVAFAPHKITYSGAQKEGRKKKQPSTVFAVGYFLFCLLFIIIIRYTRIIKIIYITYDYLDFVFISPGL